MFLKRAAWSIAAIFLALTATVAQGQVQGTVAPGQTQTTTVTPPLFQGIMVDATGKTVGRIYINALLSGNLYPNFFNMGFVHLVIRQIDGVWVGLPVTGFTSGFTVASDPTAFSYFYQSIDCTGQAYMSMNGSVNNSNLATAPAVGFVATIPPSTVPYIYFAGTPAWVQISSARYPTGNCYPVGPQTAWVGPIQSVPVSSLGLTLPFKVK
jgi:hypothetical protein